MSQSDPGEDPKSPSAPTDESPSPADETSTKPTESTEQTSETPAEAAEQSEKAASNESEGEALPEWEPLTPELMEDECLRGDAMLRAAAVLLALLCGWTYITESHVLVQVRSGEYLAEHGFLPPAKDYLSAFAGERPWYNLPWLSDVVVGSLFRFGPVALTVLSALCAGATAWLLVKTNRSGVSTWWGSVCAAAAVLATLPLWQAGPTSWTPIALAGLLASLNRLSERPQCRVGWAVPVILIIWSQFSRFAFLGAVLTVGFCACEALLRRKDAAADRNRLWLIAGLALVAPMVHPFHWYAYEVPFLLLGPEIAEATAYGGVSDLYPGLTLRPISPDFWESPAISFLIAAGLAVVALVTLLMEWRRPTGWLAVFLVVNGLALASGEMLLYASIVNAVIAALAGQSWYEKNGSMEYRIETWDVFISRFGRAVTVLALFAAAYAMVNGILTGAEGRRIGTGFDPRLAARLESMSELFDEPQPGDRPFPFRLDQGDLLIWVGQKPFVDSRLGFYVGGDENLLAVHRATRKTFRSNDPSQLDPQVETWQEVFARFSLTHAVPRLWGNVPDYETFFDLLLSRSWNMTAIDAAGAVFYPIESADAATEEFIEAQKATAFVERAYRDPAPETVIVSQLGWPRPTSNYDRWLVQPLPVVSNAVQLSRHYDAVRRALEPRLTAPQAAALALLAIRTARQGLSENPTQPDAYRVLSNNYAYFDRLDRNLNRAVGLDAGNRVRSFPTMAAAYHAVQCGDAIAADYLRLFQLQLGSQHLDVALESLEEFRRLNGGALTLRNEDAPEYDAEQQENDEIRLQIMAHVDNVRSQVEESLLTGVSRMQVVSEAIENGCPKLAIELLEEDLTSLAANVPMQIAYAKLLLDVGRFEEAWDQLEGMEQELPLDASTPNLIGIVSEWYTTTALANIASGDLDRARSLWEREAQARTKSALGTLITQPFAASYLPDQHDLWAPLTARLMAEVTQEYPEQWAYLQLASAICSIEMGRVANAERVLADLVERYPRSTRRPVAAFLLSLLQDADVPLVPEEASETDRPPAVPMSEPLTPQE